MHLNEIISLITHIVGLASIIATMTPTNTDNKIVDAVSYVVDVFACNWGNAENAKR